MKASTQEDGAEAQAATQIATKAPKAVIFMFLEGSFVSSDPVCSLTRNECDGSGNNRMRIRISRLKVVMVFQPFVVSYSETITKLQNR